MFVDTTKNMRSGEDEASACFHANWLFQIIPVTSAYPWRMWTVHTNCHMRTGWKLVATEKKDLATRSTTNCPVASNQNKI